MGTSNSENKQLFFDLMLDLKPERVLDVGAGEGIYCDILKRINTDINVTAVEIWKPYIEQFNLSEKYDEVIEGDVRELENFDYDLVIFGDVLEHMTREEAIAVWEKTKLQARYAFISIPIVHYPQDDLNNNPYEVHVEEDWTYQEVLDTFGDFMIHIPFQYTGSFLCKFN